MSSTPSTWHVHSPSLPKTTDFLPREIEHCADPQEVSLGYLGRTDSPVHVMSPRILQETKIFVSNHYSSTDREKLRLTILLRAVQRLMRQTWTTNKIGALLASPLYLQEREANADRSQVYHSVRENLMSSSSQDSKSTGKPVVLFSSRNRSNQEMSFDRANFPQDINRFWETMHRYSDSFIRQIL